MPYDPLMRKVLDGLFSFGGGVTRGQYVAMGLSLMLLKYGVDALVFKFVVGDWWHPLDYLNPLYSQRMAAAPHAGSLPAWYVVFLLLWGLLFAWIGTTWSVRRAVDAGLSAWSGMFFFIPFFNYMLILLLSFAPTNPLHPDPGGSVKDQRGDAHKVSKVVLGGVGFLAFMTILYGVLVHGTDGYGMTTFACLPLAFGVGVGYFQNRRQLRGLSQTISFAVLSAVIACLALLLFALEGIICIAMAFPPVLVSIFVGCLIGRTLAIMGAPTRAAPLCLVLALPLSAWFDSEIAQAPAREVSSSIEVDAPPSVVWEHVVAFAALPEPDDWLFRTGLAYPMRARIEGRGVGAMRYCEFSTGAFVEPITVWDEPHRLGFDVVEQPIPMEEWSFYDNLRPPHLTTTFRSVRGEFRLSELPDGRTLLEGSTWYELDMAPEAYWRLWGDEIIHRIHLRVLKHVKGLSEPSASSR